MLLNKRFPRCKPRTPIGATFFLVLLAMAWGCSCSSGGNHGDPSLLDGDTQEDGDEEASEADRLEEETEEEWEVDPAYPNYRACELPRRSLSRWIWDFPRVIPSTFERATTSHDGTVVLIASALAFTVWVLRPLPAISARAASTFSTPSGPSMTWASRSSLRMRRCCPERISSGSMRRIIPSSWEHDCATNRKLCRMRS